MRSSLLQKGVPRLFWHLGKIVLIFHNLGGLQIHYVSPGINLLLLHNDSRNLGHHEGQYFRSLMTTPTSSARFGYKLFILSKRSGLLRGRHSKIYIQTCEATKNHLIFLYLHAELLHKNVSDLRSILWWLSFPRQRTWRTKFNLTTSSWH